jgi:arsenical-resistance protein 2
LEDRGIDRIKSVILSGGIKGWVQGGHEFVEWMDDFDEKAWEPK